MIVFSVPISTRESGSRRSAWAVWLSGTRTAGGGARGRGRLGLQVDPTLRPSSKLAGAIRYVLNRWPAMIRYAEDGRYPIDNNLIERLLRPAVIGRKNYLFFGSDVGGEAAATWYTIIQSARRNLVDILPYLTDVLRRLPAIVPEYLTRGSAPSPFASLSEDQLSGLRQLLPDRWVQDHPEHLLADRADELAAATARRRHRRDRRRAAVKA